MAKKKNSDFNEIHFVPKGTVRDKIQKVFLFLLKKIAQNKYLFYRDKARYFISLFKFYIYKIYRIVYLKIKYPKYYSLPYNQIRSLHATLKFLKISSNSAINFFLIDGALLGAVRHQSFAGRPSDVDLAIRGEKDYNKLKNLIPKLIKNKEITQIRKRPCKAKNFKRLQINMFGTLIDVEIFKKKFFRKKKLWVGDDSDSLKKVNTFPVSDLNKLKLIKLYEEYFLSPANPKLFLKKKFGKSWAVLKKNQFIWKK